MKSFFTYLILCILFVAGVKLVGVQQNYIRSIQKPPEGEPTASTRFFLSRFATSKSAPEVSSDKAQVRLKKRLFVAQLKSWRRI
ncbi:hypothetical protein [Spirosoma agri]|uniref:Uncharacterized protein n=1 Tax=Spirosoma agri TaxID=1987381 RepID=A0A6M0IMH0_9BACT|nr:hypothetical protein [Spirosoma agri]NEU69428.1 hypothetical protein [Spirosoma agri]